VAQLQERKESGQYTSAVNHQNGNVKQYIVNTHAFHNAMQLRKLLPSHLTKPHHYYPARHQRHQEIAKTLVKDREAKKAETRRKAQETRAKNKANEKAAQERTAALLEVEQLQPPVRETDNVARETDHGDVDGQGPLLKRSRTDG
jgi:hypothetical protein